MCTTYRFSKNIYAYSAGLNPGVCALHALAFLVIHSLLLERAGDQKRRRSASEKTLLTGGTCTSVLDEPNRASGSTCVSRDSTSTCSNSFLSIKCFRGHTRAFDAKLVDKHVRLLIPEL